MSLSLKCEIRIELECVIVKFIDDYDRLEVAGNLPRKSSEEFRSCEVEEKGDY